MTTPVVRQGPHGTSSLLYGPFTGKAPAGKTYNSPHTQHGVGGTSSLLYGSFAGKTGGSSLPNAPSAVEGTPTGGTTLDLALTDNTGGTASHRWQLAPVSTGTFTDAAGATNPSAAGVTSFAATGLTPATEYRVRARSEDVGGDSAWVEGASTVWTDNTGEGGGEIEPPVAPSISVHPANASKIAGETATFSVTATGTALTYQWQIDAGGVGSWSNISGATSSSYTTAATTVSGGTANDGDEIRVVVSGFIGPAATSNPATLTVTAAAATTQPSSATVVEPGTTSFTAAFNHSPSTYDWQYNDGAGWAAVSGGSGAATATYTIPASTAGISGRLYRCTGSGTLGSVTTNGSAALTVTPAAPTIGTATDVGSSVATIPWTDNSSGETGFTVQYETPSGAGNWTAALGATNPTAANVTSFAASALDGGIEYRFRVRTEGTGGSSAWSTGVAFETTERTLTDGRRAVYMPPLKRTVTLMRRAEILEDMDVEEDDTIRFDFSNELETGETLVDAIAGDAVVTAEVYSGTDPTPSAFLSGSRQVSSPAVRQAVNNPVAGVVYLLRCKAKTSTDRILVRAGYIKGIREGT